MLTAHIKSRIDQAKNGQIYADETFKKIVTCRVAIKDYALRIKSDFPAFDLNEWYPVAVKTHIVKYRDALKSAQEPDQIVLQGMSEVRQEIENKYKLLQDDALRVSMKQAFADLTGYKQWGANILQDIGLTLWHKINSNEADELVKKFKDNDGFKIKKRELTAEKGSFVVQITAIDPNKVKDMLKSKVSHASSAGLSSVN